MSTNTLSSIPDNVLLLRVDDLRRRERAFTLRILNHLNEVERRNLHLKLAFSSMFAYCTERLGYSASAASRRIRTARCLRRFPAIRRLLDGGVVNLSTISLVASILNEGNIDVLLDRISGKSQREVEAIVSEFQPMVAPRDRVKPICVRVRETSANHAPTCSHDRSGRGVSSADRLEPAVDKHWNQWGQWRMQVRMRTARRGSRSNVDSWCSFPPVLDS